MIIYFNGIITKKKYWRRETIIAAKAIDSRKQNKIHAKCTQSKGYRIKVLSKHKSKAKKTFLYGSRWDRFETEPLTILSCLLLLLLYLFAKSMIHARARLARGAIKMDKMWKRQRKLKAFVSLLLFYFQCFSLSFTCAQND